MCHNVHKKPSQYTRIDLNGNIYTKRYFPKQTSEYKKSYHYISFKNDQSKILLQYLCQFKDKCPSILYWMPAHLDQCQYLFGTFSVANYLYQRAINALSSILFQYFLYLFILNCCFCQKYRRFYYINDATLKLRICRFYGSEAMVIRMHTYPCHLLPNLYFGTSDLGIVHPVLPLILLEKMTGVS